MPGAPADSTAPEIDMLMQHWHQIIDRAAAADQLSRRYLIDTAPVALENNHLTVGYDPEFAGEAAQFEDDRLIIALQRAAERFLGLLPVVRFVPLKPDDPRPLPADHKVEPEKNAGGSTAANLSGPAKWYANPVVKSVVDVFNGVITDIRE